MTQGETGRTRAISFIIPVLFVAAAAVYFGGKRYVARYGPPSDQEVLDLFVKNRSRFDLLSETIRNDVVDAVQAASGGLSFLTSNSGEWIEASELQRLDSVGLHAEKRVQYRQMLDATGASRVSNGSGGDGPEAPIHVEFTLTTIGLTLVDYYQVTVIHSERELQPIVDRSTPWRDLPDNSEEYLKLDDGWYVHRRHE